MMATRRRRRRTIFPHRPRLPPQRRHLLAGLAAAFTVTLLFTALILLPLPPSSIPTRHEIHTTSTAPHDPPPAHCAATSASLGEFGDLMLSMLPRDLAFTAFVPSPESFRRVLKLRPNDSAAEGKAGGAYAVVSRVLGFSAVPRKLRSADVPPRERVRLLDSVSGLKMYAWRDDDADGALVVNGVRSECVDVVRGETVVHVMAGVLMDAEFQRSFPPEFDD